MFLELSRESRKKCCHNVVSMFLFVKALVVCLCYHFCSCCPWPMKHAGLSSVQFTIFEQFNLF